MENEIYSITYCTGKTIQSQSVITYIHTNFYVYSWLTLACDFFSTNLILPPQNILLIIISKYNKVAPSSC